MFTKEELKQKTEQILKKLNEVDKYKQNWHHF